MKKLSLNVWILAVMFACGSGRAEATVITGSTLDATPQDSSNPADGTGDAVHDATKNALRVGAFATPSPTRRSAVFVFDLPVAGALNVAGASFSARLFSKPNAPGYNVDLYAMRISNPADGDSTDDVVLASDYGAGASPAGTLLQEDYLVPGSPYERIHTDSAGDAALLAYLQSNWISGGRLFLRANADTLDFSDNGSGGTIDQGYDFGSANHASISDHPELNLSIVAIPEPSSILLGLLGAVAMLLRKLR